MQPHPLPWIPPLALARAFAGEDMVLLYSGVQAGYSGQRSFLARGVAEEITGDDFAPLAVKLSSNRPRMENAWFGWLAYDLKDRLEALPKDAPGMLNLPPLWMARFQEIYCFDHLENTLICWSERAPHIPPGGIAENADTPTLNAVKLMSNMSKKHYLESAARVIADIHAGELYQANLTRKFFGQFDAAPDALALFTRLASVSPAPYSAFIRRGGTAILSSSPERFLTMDAAGSVTTRPIKGTAPRHADAKADAAARDGLLASAKDQAENLMIVDLMRNDLARSCAPGSVETERLFELTSHATVHHLSSTIAGHKRADVASIELVKACFPPGSMTGAPKIAAMKLCTELERQARGLYSGALGWFGGDGSCDLSVVIRTLIIQDRQFEFQVGGGIVADSVPELEWQETLHKARAVAAALNLPESALAAI